MNVAQVERVRTKLRLAKAGLLILKFNEHHDEHGRFASSDGEGGAKEGRFARTKRIAKKVLIALGVVGAIGAAIVAGNEVNQTRMRGIRRMADATARSMDFDPKDIDVKPGFGILRPGGGAFVLTAGQANLGTGKIQINSLGSALSGSRDARSIVGVLTHEITHQKFMTFLNAGYSVKPGVDWGTLYSASEWSLDPALHQMGQDGRVTPYASLYWDGVQNRTIPPFVAIHETLAEMSRIKRKTGTLPGGSEWAKLYNDMDAHWKKGKNLR